MTIITPLWEHQKRMVNEAIPILDGVRFNPKDTTVTKHENLGGGCFWFADCGVGKTLATFALMERLQAHLVLVITIKNAIEQVWVDDANDHTKDIIVLPLIKGSSKQKNKLMLEETRKVGANPLVVVVNYETARLLDLQKVDWDLVVADESHRLGGYNSKQSLELAQKCAHVPNKLIMTGTAWADSPAQVYGQFRFLYPIVSSNKRKHHECRLFGSFAEWRERYAIYYMLDNIPIIKGYKNQEELGKVVTPYMIRIKREEAIDLPPITHIKRYVDMSGKLKKAYIEMKKEMTTYVDGDLLLAEHLMTQSHRLRQLVRGWYKAWLSDEVTRFEDKSGYVALDLTLELLDEIGSNPTVIYTTYKEDVAILGEALQKLGKKVKYLTAELHQHKEFNDGDGDVLIANIGAGSTGIKLYRASYLVYYTMANSRTQYLQSIDRVHRPGQMNPVTVYHILVRNSIDELMYKYLTNKATQDELLQEMLQ